jgi:hypothetical protein
MDLTNRLREQYPDALDSGVIKETETAIRTLRKDLLDRTKEGRQAKIDEDKENRYIDKITKLKDKYPNWETDPEQSKRYHSEKADIREAMGYERIDSQVLQPGEIAIDEGGNVTAKGAPKITTIPKDGTLVQTDSITGNTTIVPLDKAEEIKPPDYIADDGSFTVTGETEVRQQIKALFGYQADVNGNPIGLDTANRNFHIKLRADIAKKAQENTKGVYKYKSISEIISAVINEIDPKDMPKSLNLIDLADGIIGDLKAISSYAKTFEWGKKGNSEIVKDVQTDIRKIEKMDLGDATGMFSGLTDTVGSMFGSFFDVAVDKPTTIARFQYGLLVRDFVRKFTLSPRFAVKEQELLRAMFPGPGLLNSPLQAAAAMREFDMELDRSITDNRNIIQAAGVPIKDKLAALKDLRYIVGMKNRLNRFDITGLELASEENPVRITDASIDDILDRVKKEPGLMDKIRQRSEEIKQNRKTMPPPSQSESAPSADEIFGIENTPEAITNFAQEFIQKNSDDPIGAFLNVIKEIGESDIGDAILDKLRSTKSNP